MVGKKEGREGKEGEGRNTGYRDRRIRRRIEMEGGELPRNGGGRKVR